MSISIVMYIVTKAKGERIIALECFYPVTTSRPQISDLYVSVKYACVTAVC